MVISTEAVAASCSALFRFCRFYEIAILSCGSGACACSDSILYISRRLADLALTCLACKVTLEAGAALPSSDYPPMHLILDRIRSLTIAYVVSSLPYLLSHEWRQREWVACVLDPEEAE